MTELKIIIGDYEIDFTWRNKKNIWIRKSDGEGGEFDKEKFIEFMYQAIENFYKENF